MAEKYVQLQWQRSFAVSTTEATGDSKNAKGVILLSLDEKITDHFNIPSSETVDEIPLQKIEAFTRTRSGIYLDTTGTGTTISVDEFFRLSGGNSRDKTARVKSGLTYTTPKGKTAYRTVGIQFPMWFDLIMITQALGQMLKANKPKTFSVTGQRGGTTIYYNTLTTPFLHKGVPIDKGAWLLTGSGEYVNTDDLTQVADVTEVKPARRRKTA
jgi:hypothetical protein